RLADDGVIAGEHALGHAVVAGPAECEVVTVISVDRIVAGIAEQRVVTVVADDEVVPAVAGDQVVAAVAFEEVVGRRSDDRVVPGTADGRKEKRHFCVPFKLTGAPNGHSAALATLYGRWLRCCPGPVPPMIPDFVIFGNQKLPRIRRPMLRRTKE